MKRDLWIYISCNFHTKTLPLGFRQEDFAPKLSTKVIGHRVHIDRELVPTYR